MTVEPRQFLLSLSGTPLSDAPFEQRVRPFEPIPDNTRTQSVRSTITVAERAENITIQSLVVYVQIRHEFIGDLRVTLVPPEATGIEEVVLYTPSEEDEWSDLSYFFRVYSSQGDVGRAPMASDLEQGEWVLRADAGLASLVGNSAQGEWVLTVGDYAGKDVGRLEMWGLEINKGARVTAGDSVILEATLSSLPMSLGDSRLFPGESLEVYWTYPQGMSVTLSPPTVPKMRFSAKSSVTLNASPGTLAPVFVGTFPVNALVSWSALPVMVEFRLVFDPPEIGILTGTTETVNLSLSGALGLSAADEVSVELMLGDRSVVSVVSLTSLVFSASTPSYVISLSALAGGGTTLVAMVKDSPSELSDMTFEGDELRVNIVDERRFEWVFRSAQTGVELFEAMVVANGTTQLLVSLEGVSGERLGTDEQVQAMFIQSPYLEMDPMTLMIAGDMSQAATLSAVFNAEKDGLQLQLTVSAVPERTTILDSSTLPVTLVERRFELQLNPAKVVIGRNQVQGVEVQLSLVAIDDQSMLGDGEEVEVVLIPDSDPMRVKLEPSLIFFSPGKESVTLKITTEDAEDEEATWLMKVDPVNTEYVPKATLTATLRTSVKVRVRVFLEGPLQ